MPQTFVINSPDGSIAEVTVFADAAALIACAADFIASSAADAIAARGSFAIALAGGNTPKPVYQRLVSAAIDWTRVQVFFGDERCVPPSDTRSNFHMAKAAMLDHVAIPAGSVHRMRGEDPPEAAAEAYAADLRNALGDDGPLDLVLLGLGQDAHTASLFPGLAAVTETRRTVMAAYVEFVGMWRLTLTPRAITRRAGPHSSCPARTRRRSCTGRCKGRASRSCCRRRPSAPRSGPRSGSSTPPPRRGCSAERKRADAAAVRACVGATWRRCRRPQPEQ